MIAFDDVTEALKFCGAVQLDLLQQLWPDSLLREEGSLEEQSLLRGLRVRVGMSFGLAQCDTNPRYVL